MPLHHLHATAGTAGDYGHDDDDEHVHRLKVRAERRAGELLGESNLHGGDRKSSLHDGSLKLSDIGISHTQSHRWQTIASIPQPDFDADLQRLDADLHHHVTGSTMNGWTCTGKGVDHDLHLIHGGHLHHDHNAPAADRVG